MILKKPDSKITPEIDSDGHTYLEKAFQETFKKSKS